METVFFKDRNRSENEKSPLKMSYWKEVSHSIQKLFGDPDKLKSVA